MKCLSLCLLGLCAAVWQAVAPAQPIHPPAKTVVSPEVMPDNRVTFRLAAPEAKSVTITGDWVQTNLRQPLVKDEHGVWSVTTDPLAPDYYSYYFIVDGVPMPDPVNIEIKADVEVMESMFEVAGPDAAFLDKTTVPHGEVRIVYYPAAVLGQTRRMHIYFPPGYKETEQTRYPVVYLRHGGGDDDATWSAVGRVNFILDNLIAQGKAKPMIVVMMNNWAIGPPVPANRAAENQELAWKTLAQDVIPFVESHYKVLPGIENRALAGTGGPNILGPEFKQFNTFFGAAGGLSADRFAAEKARYSAVLDDPANIKRVKFFIGGGLADPLTSGGNFLAEQMKARGYHVKVFQTAGTHGWPNFRRCFAEFAQTAFQ